MKFAERTDLKCPHHTHTKKELCEVMDVLISLIVVICKKKKNTIGKLKNSIELSQYQERQENYRLTQEVQNLRNRSTE